MVRGGSVEGGNSMGKYTSGFGSGGDDDSYENTKRAPVVSVQSYVNYHQTLFHRICIALRSGTGA